MANSEINVCMFLSGGGSTAEQVLKARKKGELDGINPVAIITSKHTAEGIQNAQAFDIPIFVVNPRDCADDVEFGDKLLTLLQDLHVDLISQNGWLPKTPKAVVQAYRDHFLNQHPGPLDAGFADFGGKGMHGTRVTCARLAYAWLTGDPQEYWTEATVHHVTEEFDKGALINVSRMDLPSLYTNVTVAELMNDKKSMLTEAAMDTQASLLPREHALVVETLRTIGATGNIPIYERMQRLVPELYIPFVDRAKQISIACFPNKKN